MGFDRRLLLILIGFLAVGGGCKKKTPKAEGEPGLVVVQRPELVMDQLKVQSYGPLGLEWEMTAPTADGTTAKNQMHAENIKISFFQNGKKSTDLAANEGIIRFDNRSQSRLKVSTSTALSSATVSVPYVGTSTGMLLSESPYQFGNLNPGDMLLTGDVVAVSTDGSKLTTDWLWFDKSREIIFSTAPVKIVREDSVTKGVGLEATSDLSSIKIFKQTLTIKEKAASKKK